MLNNFVCARYRFCLEAVTPLRLSRFAGATLRGGFGHVFKRSVCIWPRGDCQRCLLKTTCSYPYIFETAPPPSTQKLRRIEQIPRPFVIEPPDGDLGQCLGMSADSAEARGTGNSEGPDGRTYSPGQRFEFRLVLVGRAMAHLPYFVFTFAELGKIGLGPERGQYRLVEIEAENQNVRQRVFGAEESVLHNADVCLRDVDLVAEGVSPTDCATVHFLTPTRILTDGNVHAEISFANLVRALLRRLSSLCYFHCGTALELDFRGLIDQAARVRTVDSQLRWHVQGRFSGRQHQRIAMGGVVGSVTYKAPNADTLAAYRPFLTAGEWVHVGKGCVMGLGKYRVEVLK